MGFLGRLIERHHAGSTAARPDLQQAGEQARRAVGGGLRATGETAATGRASSDTHTSAMQARGRAEAALARAAWRYIGGFLRRGSRPTEETPEETPTNSQ